MPSSPSHFTRSSSVCSRCSMDKKVVLITGCSSGIGLSLAVRLASDPDKTYKGNHSWRLSKHTCNFYNVQLFFFVDFGSSQELLQHTFCSILLLSIIVFSVRHHEEPGQEGASAGVCERSAQRHSGCASDGRDGPAVHPGCEGQGGGEPGRHSGCVLASFSSAWNCIFVC